MSLASTTAAINKQTLAYLPAAIAGIQAAEVLAPEGTTGEQKFNAVMEGIGATSAALEGSPNVTVASVAALVNLGVLIAHLIGAFRHKAQATAQ
jgi:hypothetical protein